MTDTARIGTGLRVLLALAAFVIIVAGLRAAASLVVPFLMAAFLAILSGPPLSWLRRRGLPKWLALVLVLGVLCAAAAGVVMLVGTTANQFLEAWDTRYQQQVGDVERELRTWIRQQVEKRDWLETVLEPPPNGEAAAERGAGGATAVEAAMRMLNPEPLLNYVTTALRALGGVLGQTVFILITTMFLVAETSNLPTKLRSIAPDSDENLETLQRVADGINRYMAIKTATSFLTGLLIAIGLSLLGVDFALLWGLLAFLLNFIPTFGSIIAAVPAVGIALLQFGWPALWVPIVAAVWYLIVNSAVAYFLEPMWMGRGTGMSAMVVFVSLVFWGWVLGPIGMFISVPLTMTVKIALETSDDTRWLAILMGSRSSASPAE